MKKLTLLLTLVICKANLIHLYGQNPFYSESLIKYDVKTHKTDKPIPFDHSFTLTLEKLSSKNIFRIEAYEVTFEKGKRIFKKNTYQDCDGSTVTAPIRDVMKLFKLSLFG